jgi:hypothetical protein
MPAITPLIQEVSFFSWFFSSFLFGRHAARFISATNPKPRFPRKATGFLDSESF